MNIIVSPFSAYGEIAAPTSKSEAHRMLICAALSNKETHIGRLPKCDDVAATVQALEAIGTKITCENGDTLVQPIREARKNAILNCRESGSTLRFLLPIIWALGGGTLDGTGSLKKRPLIDLINAMKQHGAVFSGDVLPFSVNGAALGGVFTLSGQVSSQFVSGLLLAAPLLRDDVEIRLTGTLESASYVSLTRRVMAQFGVETEKTENGFFVRSGQTYQSPKQIVVSGDWSGAAFLLAIGALGREVRLTGLSADSEHADKKIMDFLRQMGAEVSVDAHSVRAKNPGMLHSITADVSQAPDLAPVLGALMAHTEGTSCLTGIRRLRFKESDRAKGIVRMVRAHGAVAEEQEDRLIIRGQPNLRGGTVDGQNDHRLVMAACVAASACEQQCTILDAQAVQKSYPNFFDDFRALGGKIHGIDLRK